MVYKLVLLRHGQSEWNLANKFTGWTDVELTKEGEKQARQSGVLLKDAHFHFDIVFTSFLKRAINTTKFALTSLGQQKCTVEEHWELNERHYGSLQGLNKADTAKKYGDDQVLIWRRSFDTKPPLLEKGDERNSFFDAKYKALTESEIPLGESLQDTINRVIPFWDESITPLLKQGKSILVSAHGNSLRALVYHLDKMNKKDILKLNIPCGIPLVYELDKDLTPIRHYYLGDENEIKKQISSVANQGKSS